MSSFFENDHDDEEQSMPIAPRGMGQQRWQNPNQTRAHQAAPAIGGPSRQRDHRESSILSSSSLAGGGSRSFLDRLETTLSPKSERYSRSARSLDIHSVVGDDEDMARSVAGDSDILGGDEDEELDDVRKMGRVWVRERGTIDIMRWEGDLIDSLFDKLEQQQKMVETLRADPQTSEEEHFKLMLVQTEMERVKFLIRSYVRTRLHKIEKYSHHIVLTPTLHPLLSGAEISHARRYTELLHTHFQHSVLDSLPDWLRKMDDTYGDGLSMVAKPKRNIPVLIYCRRDCGEITLEGGEGAALARGTTHLVKYSLVERWIALGWAEVL